MDLIKIYIQEVTRRLPEKNREDIALELSSTIGDMLPDEYSDEDVNSVLEKLGSPVALAYGYRDKPMYLIGPRYFDVYVSLLKMIFPIALIVSFISIFAEYTTGYSEESLIKVMVSLLSKGILTIFEVGIQFLFWITLVFVILERTDKGNNGQPLTATFKKWKPEDLKDIPYIPKKKTISRIEIFGSLLWIGIWATLYFYAERLLGVYTGSLEGLKLVAPMFNQEILLRYWPLIIIVIGLELTFVLYKLIKGQWTKRVAIFNTVQELVGAVAFIIIIVTPNLLTLEFIDYMTELFSITSTQFMSLIIGGGIFILLISSAMSIFDGFRKAKIG
ncbi:hypothetical protein J27TS8_11800 [Robertmurraya siralis]|uniref:Uncharacterized protein n=1 Tax=Robertmurraya siralis TaxID=77777 RepID=A0A919WG67_9BACI|nr:hypothetical protein [Robertmurraya siralis]GIN61187.1 hypothetical protein J27TS8_11800 [Robertmurraya siralis]